MTWGYLWDHKFSKGNYQQKVLSYSSNKNSKYSLIAEPLQETCTIKTKLHFFIGVSCCYFSEKKLFITFLCEKKFLYTYSSFKIEIKIDKREKGSIKMRRITIQWKISTKYWQLGSNGIVKIRFFFYFLC